MNYFTARNSDLGGAFNPKHIWSYKYVALKKAVDGGNAKEISLKLRAWLLERGIQPYEINKVWHMDANAAYEEIIKLMQSGLNAAKLPETVSSVLRKAMQIMAHDYTQAEQQKLDATAKNLQGIRARFGLTAESSAAQLVKRLCED